MEFCRVWNNETMQLCRECVFGMIEQCLEWNFVVCGTMSSVTLSCVSLSHVTLADRTTSWNPLWF